MTIQQAIDHVDKVRPNQYEFNVKVGWLSKLDGMIFREVFLTHYGCGKDCFDGYSEADADVELIVPYPYDEDVYNYYLQSQIDKENGEIVKYNQSSALFNTAYKTFCDYWNRTHVPLPRKAQFIF